MRTVLPVALACMVATWTLVLVLAFFPGLMSADPLASLEQGISGSYDNTNPPLLGALAGWSYRLTASIWPLLLVQLLALGGGMAALAGRMRSRMTALALLATFLALPTVWSTAIVVWKDVATCAALLLAVVALSSRRPWLGTLLLVFAASCRLNAILAVVPLACWAGLQLSSGRQSRARQALTALAILLAGLSLPKVIDRVFKARDAWALAWVLTDDLGAIYARAPDAFAGSMFASETSAADLARLYSADSSVPLFFGGSDGLRRINLALLPNRRAELLHEWGRVVVSHPRLYLATRAERFKQLLGLGRDVVYYPFHIGIDPNAFGLSLRRADRQPHLALRHVQEWARNKLFRGWIWLTLLVATAAVAYHRHRGRALATWVAASGIVYALGYFVVAPAADFRYLFWSMVSAFAALALLGSDRAPTESRSSPREADPPPEGSRILKRRSVSSLPPFPDVMHRLEHDLKVLVPEHNFGSSYQRRNFAEIPFRGADRGAGSPEDLVWPAAGIAPGSTTVRIRHSLQGAATAVATDSSRRDYQIAGSSYLEAEELGRQLTTGQAQTIVIGDLLQRLEDPRALLRTLRSALQLDRRNRLILSIFDPSLPLEGHGGGPPANRTHLRLWTRDQARAFLLACGFELVAERTSARDDGETLSNHSFAFSCSHEQYRAHLTRLGLPGPTLESLLFATEHSACKVTGGIGAYVAQMEDLLPAERFRFCYVGDPGALPATAHRNWLLPSLFIDPEEWRRLAPPDVAFRLLQALVFLYPDIKQVEFQEYLGLGHLASAAKRSGLLPADLSIKTRCHGSQIYLEACFSKWTGFEQLETVYQEKLALERADVVSFPSRFLLDLYLSKGYAIDRSKVEIKRYPFTFPEPSPLLEYKPIETLIFFGKRTRMKGFPLFVEALAQILQRPSHGIGRVVVIGRVDATLDQENRALAEFATRVEVIEFEGPRAEAIALIETYADSALCVMPYQGDNHPMAVIEAAATGCTILAANAGGIPEMIPESFHRLFLHQPTRDRLTDACTRILDLPPAERGAETRACLTLLRAAYATVNKEHLASAVPAADPASKREGRRSSVGVIVPCFNSKLEQIRDLVYGLNSQARPPDEVCFVDDGSRPGYASELEGFLAGHLAVPFRVVRHDVNRGLASARNTGLRSLNTDYVINLDSDDIPKAEFVSDYVRYLDNDPGAVAVTSWLESFPDGANWLDAAACSVIYRPMGDGLLLAQTQNCLGHANSAFRRDYLLSIGGWDETDKSMWEDWALFLRIVSAGQRLGAVPRSNMLYRVHSSSMLRTYAAFPAMNRLARNLNGLSRFEAYRLQGLMRSYEELRQAHQRLSEQVHEERTALTARLARRVADNINRRPRLKRRLKKLVHVAESVLDRVVSSPSARALP